MSAELPRAPLLEAPIIQYLASKPGPQEIAEIDTAVARELALTPEQLALPHNPAKAGGRSEFAYRMAWARTRLKAKGAIENTGLGKWALVKK